MRGGKHTKTIHTCVDIHSARTSFPSALIRDSGYLALSTTISLSFVKFFRLSQCETVGEKTCATLNENRIPMFLILSRFRAVEV